MAEVIVKGRIEKTRSEEELWRACAQFLEEHANLQFVGEGGDPVAELTSAAERGECPLERGFRCTDFQHRSLAYPSKPARTPCWRCAHAEVATFEYIDGYVEARIVGCRVSPGRFIAWIKICRQFQEEKL